MEKIAKSFKDLLDDIAKEQKFVDYNVDIKEISSGGANYTSKLFSVSITEGTRTLRLFCKVAAIGEQMRMQLAKIYETEHFFYTKLGKIYRSIEDQCGIPHKLKLNVSKYYGSITKLNEEVMVLEDLVAAGYEAYDRFKSIDWPYAHAAVRELAKFHACSWAYAKQDPEEFDEVMKKVMFDVEFNNENMQAFMTSMVNKAIDTVHDENKSKLQKYFDNFDVELYTDIFKRSRRLVLGHGDFRPSNLMHKNLDDGSVVIKVVDLQTLQGGSPVTDLIYFIFTGSDEKFRARYFDKLLDHYYSELSAAMKRLHLNTEKTFSQEDFDHEMKEDGSVDIKVVDLQTMHAGSPVSDLIYFIIAGTDEKFRAQYFDKLLDHYYTELSAAMKRLQLNPDEIFSREDFDSELKKKLPYGLLLAIVVLPVFTVEMEDAPQVGNLDVTKFNVEKTSDLYAERLNGVVNDYVKWGILK